MPPIRPLVVPTVKLDSVRKRTLVPPVVEPTVPLVMLLPEPPPVKLATVDTTSRPPELPRPVSLVEPPELWRTVLLVMPLTPSVLFARPHST